MSNPLQKLSDILGPKIAALEQRARAALSLTDRVRAALPDPEKNHIVAASYKAQELIVLTDSAAWCTRIRYMETQLTAALRKAGETSLARIKIRVGLPGEAEKNERD